MIKESVDVKTEAFVQLFESYGINLVKRVRSHHLANGGMSRFEKIPLYLNWAGEKITNDLVQKLCEQFGQLTFQGVLDSPWVPGIENYLRNNYQRQVFVLLSATPQKEIEKIVMVLGLKKYFKGIFGAPIKKKDAIQNILNSYKINPRYCLVVGDARVDWEAAEFHRIPFLLRKHETNAAVFSDYKGPAVMEFVDHD